MDGAFEYVETNKLETEADYPYTAKGGDCVATAAKGVVGVTGYTDVTKNSAAQLEAAVALGPVSVAIQADQRVFQNYNSGVIPDDGSCGTALDHGVLAVGWGSDSTGQWWIVKNSWGATWGEKGYVRLEKNAKANNPGTCGIQMQASFPKA